MKSLSNTQNYQNRSTFPLRVMKPIILYNMYEVPHEWLWEYKPRRRFFLHYQWIQPATVILKMKVTTFTNLVWRTLKTARYFSSMKHMLCLYLSVILSFQHIFFSVLYAWSLHVFMFLNLSPLPTLPVFLLVFTL